jgi:hypothetical protein
MPTVCQQYANGMPTLFEVSNNFQHLLLQTVQTKRHFCLLVLPPHTDVSKLSLIKLLHKVLLWFLSL